MVRHGDDGCRFAQAQLLQLLQSRSDTIADSLYQALAPTSFVPLEASVVRQRLVELTTQAIAFLSAEPFQRSLAEAIGASLAGLHFVQPEALGQAQEVLARELLAGLPAEQVVALQSRLAALLGSVVAGFFRQAREIILVEQEQIHHALVAARQQAEEALQESEQTAQALLNALTEAAILLDPDGTFVALNRAAAENLGREPEELVGMCAFDYLPADVAASRKAYTDLVARSGQPVRFEDRRGARYFDQSIYPVFDAQGEKVVRLAIYARDITEQKAARQELQEQAERLRLLHEIDAAILAAQSPEEISQTVVGRLRRVIPCFGAGVALFDFETRQGSLLWADIGDRISDGRTRVWAGTRFSLDALEGIEEALQAMQRGEIRTTDQILLLARAVPQLRALRERGLGAVLIAPLIARQALIGFLGLGAERADAFNENQMQTVRELANSLAIAIQQARLFQSVKQQHEQLRELTARLAEAEEAERRRLAGELHDQVGRNLAVLGMNLHAVQAYMPEQTPQVVRFRLHNSLALLEEAAERVRGVMADLHPPMLDDFGLLATLQWYGTQFSAQTDIAVKVQGEEPDPRLPAPTENALFRIAQEALANVAKHARATQVTATLAADKDRVRLVIADDGVGFDPAQLNNPGAQRGLGLLTMTERAQAVGGRVHIHSKAHRGTQLIVEVAR